MDSIFKDLKIVELASVLAGPAVGMFFAELGAQVTKIENKNTNGDVTRGWRLPNESKERDYSAYYCSVNWQKEVVLLDLKSEVDRESLFDLIGDTDIVIANYRPGSAERLGVDYQSLKQYNPKLIYANLTSFGEKSTRPAFDIVLQAETGFLYMTGEADRAPVRMPVALIDILAAHQLKEAILIALLKRYQTGKGSFVSTSLYESALASLANQATNWLMESHIPQRMGSQHPNIAPYGDIFYTLDEKAVVLAVGTEKQFKQLLEVLRIPELGEDGRFATNASRVIHREALNEILADQFRKHEATPLMEELIRLAVPAGLIRNMEEVFTNPTAQEMILEEVKNDGTLSKRVKTVAFEFLSE